MNYLTEKGFTPIPVTINSAHFILLRFSDTLYSPRLGPKKVLAAHYDSSPGSPGANDNASGVAALLELSRLFLASSPKRTLRFVAFVNEEAPFFFTSRQGDGCQGSH